MLGAIYLGQAWHSGWHGLNSMIVESKLIIKITPRSLAQRARSLPSKDRLKFGILAIIWRLPNNIILVFDALRRRRLSKHQFLILVRSLFRSSTTDAHCWQGKVMWSLLSSTCLGFARLRNRGQVVDINIEQDVLKDAPLLHSALNWKFVWEFGIYMDSLKSIGQIARKPVKSCRRQADILQL